MPSDYLSIVYRETPRIRHEKSSKGKWEIVITVCKSCNKCSKPSFIVSCNTPIRSQAGLKLMFLPEMKTLKPVATHSSWRLYHCFALDMACVIWIQTYLRCSWDMLQELTLLVQWENFHLSLNLEQTAVLLLNHSDQYLGNCPPSPPQTQQQSIDNKLGLMLG